ncbi:MAG: FtsW/RodA/SpoVE family cell cycle protein, partial [Ruminococcus sp.]|nr:FtsW/RodA/SpoVE family cell cycle protein [Ruminococcus sp.]
MLRKSKNTDILLLILTLACCVGGVILVFSLVYNNGSDAISSNITSSLWKTKLAAMALGLVCALIIYTLGIKRIAKLWLVFIIIGVALTALTFTSLGIGPAGADDKAWLNLKGFTIQPSEILKICFIISFAVHISKVKERLNKPIILLSLIIHAAIPIAIV